MAQPHNIDRKFFFLFCTKLFEYGFLAGTWNFFEASHGKGAADGVGAVLKRTADRLVKQGHDLPTAQEVYNKLCQETNVVLYFIESVSVDYELEQFDASHPDLQTVPGSMILHQVFADSCHPGQVLYRDVSCFCSGVSAICHCYDNKPYPGKILEINETDVTVECMH